MRLLAQNGPHWASHPDDAARGHGQHEKKFLKTTKCPELTYRPFDNIDTDVEVVSRSVYSVSDLLAYVGGYFSSVKGLFAIIALIILNNSAEIATWD